jgi:hypothetical protein
MKRNMIYFGIAATLCASVALAAEQLFVNSESVDIVSGKSGLSDVVKNVPKGTQLTVLSQDADGWLQVQSGDAQGYVFKDALSPNKPSGDFTASMNVDTGMTTANAGKGMGPEANQWALGKNLSPAAMDALVAFSHTIKQSDLDAFATAGSVGKFKPAPAVAH